MEPEIYQKEYTIGKILTESWEKFKENFQVILLITLIVYIPVNVILAFVPVDTLTEQYGFAQSMRIYMRIIQLLEFLIGIIATMAIAYVIKSKIDGKTVGWEEAMKKSLSRWPAALGTNFLLGLFLVGLIILLVIPGIIYYVYWIFVSYVVILNNKSGNAALDYSKSIVKGRWWRVTGYAVVFGLLGLVVAIIMGIPYWFLPETFWMDIGMDTAIEVALSFFTVVSTIFFINFDATKTSNPLTAAKPS